jgi:ABC-2 type transport system permease protein
MKTNAPTPAISNFARVGLPVLVAILIVISAVLSLVTIISIYREGGILKRLRATPLHPQTILSAHVIVKLLLTAVSLFLMILAGKSYIPPGVHPPLFSFAIAMLLSTWSILSIGFVIASIVPTARFAQPIGAIVLYPMMAFSGLFVPIAAMPPVFRALAHALPMTYAVSLLQGIWMGDPWSAHLLDVAALVLFFLLFTALSARIFRWE